jgi:hypothetical protein
VEEYVMAIATKSNREARTKPSFEPANTESLTFRLRPNSILELKRLARRYGGVGRAIQVAAEILRERADRGNKQIKAALARQAPLDSKPQELFSFPAVPKTKHILAHLGLRYYDGTKNLTIRACIQLLGELEQRDEMIPGIPKDEIYDPDKP